MRIRCSDAMWLGISHASASSPTVYSPCKSICTIRKRCGCANNFRQCAASSSTANGVKARLCSSLFVFMIIVYIETLRHVNMFRHKKTPAKGKREKREERDNKKAPHGWNTN